MKRWPLAATFVLFIALCISAAYWAMQWFKPPPRPVAAPQQVAQQPGVRLDAAASLFGGSKAVTAAGNFQLKGVVVADRMDESVAILSVDGKPAQSVRLNAEVTPGVEVAEVQTNYILLSENGSVRRVDLPENLKRRAKVGAAGVPVRKNELTIHVEK